MADQRVISDNLRYSVSEPPFDFAQSWFSATVLCRVVQKRCDSLVFGSTILDDQSRNGQ